MNATHSDPQRTSKPVHHVFVDCENVPAVTPSIIGAESSCFTLLLGARQNRLDIDLVEKLMAHASTVQLVRLTSSGRNALDFALAYYLGRAVSAHPRDHFHIVSKDTGFDALIEHLRTRHFRVDRHDEFASLPIVAAGKPGVSVPENPLDRVLTHLRKNITGRPKRKMTLARHLQVFIGKPGAEAEVSTLIETLIAAGHISLGAKDAVTYHL